MVRAAALLLLAAAPAFGMFEFQLRGAQYMLRLYEQELAALGRRPDLGATGVGGVNYTEKDDIIKMRDGATLYTRVFFPPNWTGKGACVYQQVPYELSFHNMAIIPVWEIMLKFNVSVVLVLQETRSRYNSTGSFNFFRDSEQDAQDTFDFLVTQDWSNGVIIPWGVSAMGIKVFLTSAANYTIRAQAMSIAANEFRSPANFRNGEVNTGIMSVIAPFLNISVPELAPELTKHEAPSSWWDGAAFSDWAHIDWPTIQGTGWFDLFAQNHIDAFENTRAQSAEGVKDLHRFVIDPLGHCGLRGHVLPDMNATALNVSAGAGIVEQAVLFGLMKDADNAVNNKIALIKLSFAAAKVPRYIWYVLGSGMSLGAGHYVTGRDEWPDFVLTPYYPAADGTLGGSAPQGGNKSYVYDPADPVPTVGGYQFQAATCGCGQMDQTLIGPRKDVLSFTAAPITEPMAITGRVKFSVDVSSSANDTDFTAKLVDVFPNGTRLFICGGVQTMRWREGGTKPQFMTPGKTYNVEIDLWSTSWIFAAGHAVGLDVSSSNSPALRPNPNTGASLADQVDTLLPMTGNPNVTATNTVHFGSNTAVRLPVVKISDLPYLPPISPTSLLL
eukprot:TRINITY_DN1868_c0_g1_i1.p1 TRINITY_DN1868_c0_g1~~TRINITY_DN1868_c0_g1_i1.p1  ORF type:complete len:638 (+),score=233.76 TRINITY_DN1868_c0_g1_i1:77-1915(+)